MKKNDITPRNFSVLAEVTELPTEENGVYTGPAAQTTKTEQAYYYGTAIKLGDRSNEEDQCPELKEGDKVVFDQVAGYHLPTEDAFCKLVRGSNIVAIVEDFEDMAKEGNIKPTGKRILVEVIGESLIEGGVWDDTSEDPRELDTQKGRIIKCAEGADQYEVGTIVGFEPYCGNPIFNDGKTFLKTINSFDVLFSLSE